MIADDSPYLGWPGKPRLRFWDQFALGVYWLPNLSLWTGLLLIILPEKVASLVGNGQATGVLSWTGILGTLVASVVTPVFGVVSDNLRARMGRRRPLMIWGTVGSFLFLLLLAYGQSLWLFVVGLLGLQFLSNVAQASYQGLIPDLVPPEQRGEASGYMGLFNQAGTLVGSILAAFTSIFAFVWATIGMLGAALLVTIGFVSEPSSLSLPHRSLGTQFKGFFGRGAQYRDFWWVFATRFLVMSGLYVLQQYLYYYLKFVLGIKDPVTDVFFLLIILTVTALIAALVMGFISDRLRSRRLIVSLAGILQGACALLFVVSHSLVLIYVAAVVFGLGYGAYQTVDWALVVDTLPGRTAARDMGVWSISTTGSQLLALFFGLLLAQFVIPHLGLAVSYRGLFAWTGLFFVAGSALVWQVRTVR
jgi:MFS family permease